MGKRVAVIFGGQSSEHEVSCMSVVNVARQVQQLDYELVLIGITEQGHWVKTNTVEDIENGSWKQSRIGAVISPDATEQCVILFEEKGSRKLRIDAAFPVLHGLLGEDGTVQGLLELARIPYVGCGVLASAVSMDKLYTKIIVDNLGIRQADYVPIMKRHLENMEDAVARVEAKLKYPVFVKPSNAGSSRGVSRADSREQLTEALKLAACYDKKILVEETIVGHEVECAAFGGGKEPIEVSGVGEILAGAEFYDFEAKYYNGESKTVVDPELPADAAERVREAALRIFRAVDGYGLSRVDFFVTDEGEVVFNEINTLPGFTAISMYPMLWEARGINKRQLIQRLIEHGMKRYEE